MDSRQQPPHHSNLMVGPTSYPPNTTIPSTMPTATFPFSSMPHHHHHHSTAPSNNNNPPSPEPLNNNNNNNSVAPYEDGSSSALKPFGLTATDSGKKKRGRPRKYSPNAGNIALALAPSTDQHVSSPPPHGGGATPSTKTLAKKHRGRPPGSGKKQLDALGAGGTGFTPHVILVEPGEDIAAKFVEFSQQGPRTVCILSARGAISNVTLRQPTTSGSTVTHEGLYEIISLSGSTPLSEKSSSGYGKTDGLSVSLAGPDGRVLGGLVAGMLKAASQVQVIVGSFIAEHKKSSSNNLKSGPPVPSPQMLSFGVPATPTSPTSQGPSSDSSDDNDNGPSNKGPGLYNNATQPVHNMPPYHHRLWAGQTQQ
ncbi:hypothetical protein TanjilG_00952 [Lupinus angustifolius]|uniref:AT-hook motif nuclear-localized protein n=1 Tax=Lupinus angustifolius TaxID=3871 RepID=A0A4P1QR04_LUPAN|nr:PREDICTED: AT-hook motif nuclear-localized protein 13-like [Lupinus angustifolius]OIV92818.1 hypothetical protein TanjilG_00952 [Lupinus angustifolius]